MQHVLDTCLERIRRIQRDAREVGKVGERPRWPVIVLRTPKGFTGPREVDGKLVEGTFRSHQVPVADVRNNSAPRHSGTVVAKLSTSRAVRRARAAIASTGRAGSAWATPVWQWGKHGRGADARHRAGLRRRHRDSRDSGGGRLAAPACAPTRSAGRQCRRSDDASPTGRSSAWHERRAFRGAFHRRHARDFRLSRLRRRGSPTPTWASSTTC